jgi:drug/metabolite transporter (DMT)-like permease
VIVMIVSALLAAGLYGTGAAVEQRQAAAAPPSSAGRPRLLVLLARQPLWLLGMAAQIAGFAAHAVALRTGPLTVVQMLVAAELIVAVLLVRCWSGRPLSRGAWIAALTVIAGIASFLVLTSPAALGHRNGQPHQAAGLAALTAALLAAAAAAAFAACGLRAAGSRRAVLLALAAGLGDTCAAVVTMAFAHLAGHDPAALAQSWTSYALVVSGAGNVLLTQTAYQAGRPLITLPIISAVTPVTSVLLGIGLLNETPGTGLAGGLAAAAAVLVTSLALAWLARAAGQPEPQHRARAGRLGSVAAPAYSLMHEQWRCVQVPAVEERRVVPRLRRRLQLPQYPVWRPPGREGGGAAARAAGGDQAGQRHPAGDRAGAAAAV